jgi:RNA polymerase sigma factor (sigma-70 family)
VAAKSHLAGRGSKGGIIRRLNRNEKWRSRLPSATSAEELRSLAERIRQGDVAAETALVREFTERIFVMGLMRTHDREAARELVQDVLVAVIGALRKGQLHDNNKLAAFVHGTARNLINNQLRSESQKPPLEPLPEHLTQASLIDQLEDAERVRLVHQALERLGHEDRKILLMTLVEGRKPGEIAAALGLTPEVVRTRKLRAVKKIADLIKKKMSRIDAKSPHSYKGR